ncbi:MULTISPECIES: permease [unclassified Ensifer]|uniref:permease n=1 Tax=unclassified Ensifer TaxID=2633371 RepID=UPI001FED92A8|nr:MULTISPECIES: permease [unclassified Ensifer]
MDFMRLLKSIEELLYELVCWLLFYPLTLWRTLRHPQAMMRYADVELGDELQDQYSDALSPPLFLLITLLLAHALELGLVRQAVPWTATSLLASDSNLLMFRAVAFSILPLLMAVKLLRSKGAKLTRETLRPPFFSQCYVTAPFAFAISLGGQLLLAGHNAFTSAGVVFVVASIVWYIVAETRWFMADLGLSAVRSFLHVVITILQALLAMAVASTIIAYASGAVPAPTH